MKPFTQTLTATAEQSNYLGVAKEDKIQLPRDYLLQRILLDVRGTMDVVTAVSVLVEDAGQRLLKEVRLEITGGKTGTKTVIKLSGVDLYFLNFYDYGVSLERVTPTGVATGQAMSFQLVIDFRLAKNDPEDYSIGIPLYDKATASLFLNWDTPAIGYGTNTANFNLTTVLTLFQGVPESSEEFEGARSNPLLTLLETNFDTSGSTGLEKRNTDVSTGDLTRRIMFTARTSANARSDVEIKSLTLKTASEVFYDQKDWDAFGLEDLTDYSLPTHDGDRHIKGVIMWDFSRGVVDERGRVLGLDLSNLKSGDVKLELDKANASSKIRYLEEIVEVVS